MAEARDVDLKAWMDGFAFHPANTRAKQLGHAIVRQLVANVAGILHALLPPGREKSLVFTHLEQALMYANKALAVGGGPRPLFTDHAETELAELGKIHESLVKEGEIFGAVMQQDPRIAKYEAQQRGEGVSEGVSEPAAGGVLDDLPFPVPQAVKEQAGQGLPTPAERAEHHPL
jgi:hypothetical protein